MNRFIKFYVIATIVFMGLAMFLSKVNPFVATISMVMALIQLFLLMAEKSFNDECHALIRKERVVWKAGN